MTPENRNIMKRTLVIVAVTAVSVLAFTGCRGKQQKNKGEEAVVETVQETKTERLTPEAATIMTAGQKAPDFTVTMLDGTEYTLSKQKGKVVLVNFWATWCPPCRQEFERMQADVVDRFAGKDFLLLPVSREEERDVVAKFMKEKGYKFNVGLDPDRSIYSKFASDYIPRNFVIDREGNVAWASVGYNAKEFEEMLALIDELL